MLDKILNGLNLAIIKFVKQFLIFGGITEVIMQIRIAAGLSYEQIAPLLACSLIAAVIIETVINEKKIKGSDRDVN